MKHCGTIVTVFVLFLLVIQVILTFCTQTDDGKTPPDQTITSDTATTNSQDESSIVKHLSREELMWEYYAILQGFVNPTLYNLDSEDGQGMLLLGFYGRNNIHNPDLFQEQFLEYMEEIEKDETRSQEFKTNALRWIKEQESEYKLHINSYINRGIEITQTDYQPNDMEILETDDLSLTPGSAIGEQEKRLDELIEAKIQHQEESKAALLEILQGRYEIKTGNPSESLEYTFDGENYTFRVENKQFKYNEEGSITTVNHQNDYIIDLQFSYRLNSAVYEHEQGEGTRTITLNQTDGKLMIVRDVYHTKSNLLPDDVAFPGVLIPIES